MNRKPTQKSSTAPNKKYWTLVFVYFNHLERSKWLEVMKTNQHLIYKNYKVVLLNWHIGFVCFSFIRFQKQCFYLKVWSLKYFWNLIDFGFKKMMKKKIDWHQKLMVGKIHKMIRQLLFSFHFQHIFSLSLADRLIYTCFRTIFFDSKSLSRVYTHLYING